MTTVYIVLHNIYYEGLRVVSVHSTEAGANAVALTPTGREKRTYDGYYSVEEYEVEE